MDSRQSSWLVVLCAAFVCRLLLFPSATIYAGGGGGVDTIQFSTLAGFGNATVAVSVMAPGVVVTAPSTLVFSYDAPTIASLSKQQNSQTVVRAARAKCNVPFSRQ